MIHPPNKAAKQLDRLQKMASLGVKKILTELTYEGGDMKDVLEYIKDLHNEINNFGNPNKENYKFFIDENGASF